MQDIKELTLEELKMVLRDLKEPEFHAEQIFSWIYQKGVTEFGAMSDLPLVLREKLKRKFYLLGLRLKERLNSREGTEKLLFALSDGNLIEAVIIPTQERITGCISTQVGCRFRCSFCASGLSGFKRNLTPEEMLDELLYLKNNSPGEKLTHIVFMGTGEPLDNYDNVLKTVKIINSKYAFNIAARRITISTCGIVPGIKRLAREGLQIELSVSLHSADEKIRSRLMPVNKIYPLKELIPACKEYIQKTNRQITFEYVLIKGVNPVRDRLPNPVRNKTQTVSAISNGTKAAVGHLRCPVSNGANSDLPSAKKLSKILKALKLCKVNLIPVNVVKQCNVEPPSKLELLFFRDYLLKQGLNVTLRRPRGQDIEAACGQLRLRYDRKA